MGSRWLLGCYGKLLGHPKVFTRGVLHCCWGVLFGSKWLFTEAVLIARVVWVVLGCSICLL